VREDELRGGSVLAKFFFFLGALALIGFGGLFFAGKKGFGTGSNKH
jgi:hypothetical protein